MADNRLLALFQQMLTSASSEEPLLADEAMRRLIAAGITIDASGNISFVNGFTVQTGGTGITSYTIGDLIYASAATVLAKLADVATGAVLVSGGVGAAPAWSSTPTLSGLLTLAAGQLKFPATQNPSADANTQDDYEEGTWTPTDASGAALIFTTVSGFYVKIGQIVIASGDLTYPATADGTTAIIGGLPFTVAATATNQWGGFFTAKTEATADTTLGLANTLTCQPLTSVSNGITNATLSTDRLRFVVIYRASA